MAVVNDYLSQEDVAERAGISYASLRQMRSVGAGQVPEPDLIDAGRPYWSPETIERWLAIRRGPGRPRSVPA